MPCTVIWDKSWRLQFSYVNLIYPFLKVSTQYFMVFQYDIENSCPIPPCLVPVLVVVAVSACIIAELFPFSIVRYFIAAFKAIPIFIFSDLIFHRHVICLWISDVLRNYPTCIKIICCLVMFLLVINILEFINLILNLILWRTFLADISEIMAIRTIKFGCLYKILIYFFSLFLSSFSFPIPLFYFAHAVTVAAQIVINLKLLLWNSSTKLNWEETSVSSVCRSTMKEMWRI